MCNVHSIQVMHNNVEMEWLIVMYQNEIYVKNVTLFSQNLISTLDIKRKGKNGQIIKRNLHTVLVISAKRLPVMHILATGKRKMLTFFSLPHQMSHIVLPFPSSPSHPPLPNRGSSGCRQIWTQHQELGTCPPNPLLPSGFRQILTEHMVRGGSSLGD